MKFSVIIPLYNKEDFIVRAVRSVLAQDWCSYELLIIDDGSTDNSGQVVKEEFRDPRIRVIAQPNAGEGAARNRGLAEMLGDAAAFLDADDEWLPTHLSDLAETASMYPEAGLLATGFHAIYSGGFVVDHSIDRRRPSLIADYYRLASCGHPVHISAVAMRNPAMMRHIRFTEDARMGEDQEFYMRATLNSPLAFHPRISSVYHHDDAGSIMANAVWCPDPPLIVQSAHAILRAETMPANKRESVATYLGWSIEQHALTGLVHGRKTEVTSLLHQARFRAIPDRCRRRLNALAFLIQVMPMPLLRLLVRYRRSRWHLPVADVVSRVVAFGSRAGEARPTTRCNKAFGKRRIPG